MYLRVFSSLKFNKLDMIPKIIHYIWFGKAKKSKVILDCIASWRIHLPEYEIKEWNELNTTFDCFYTKQAYLNKGWAFLSDYLRLKCIYEYGGIYLDTDMQVIKSFNPLLNEIFFRKGI